MVNVMNEIRNRAGMPSLSNIDITESKIRQERRCELAFEDHVFWDLRRWRIAVEELDNVRRHRLHYRYNANDNTYTMEMADGDVGGIRLHPERNYYYALGLNRLADNPKLVEDALKADDVSEKEIEDDQESTEVDKEVSDDTSPEVSDEEDK